MHGLQWAACLQRAVTLAAGLRRISCLRHPRLHATPLQALAPIVWTRLAQAGQSVGGCGLSMGCQPRVPFKQAGQRCLSPPALPPLLSTAPSPLPAAFLLTRLGFLVSLVAAFPLQMAPFREALWKLLFRQQLQASMHGRGCRVRVSALGTRWQQRRSVLGSAAACLQLQRPLPTTCLPAGPWDLVGHLAGALRRLLGGGLLEHHLGPAAPAGLHLGCESRSGRACAGFARCGGGAGGWPRLLSCREALLPPHTLPAILLPSRFASRCPAPRLLCCASRCPASHLLCPAGVLIGFIFPGLLAVRMAQDLSESDAVARSRRRASECGRRQLLLLLGLLARFSV